MRYEFSYPNVAATAQADERAAFIRRTYAHLAGAILAFVGLEALLVSFARGHEQEIFGLLAASRFSWLIVLLMFMGASWLAQTWARSEASPGLQYAGLALYVVAQAVIFLPLLYVATFYTGDPYLIPMAGILTLAVFGGLTLSVFITRKDYSFLRPVLSVGAFIALGVIVAGVLFQFTLGLLFCFAMVALLSGYILYDTSNIMLHYRTTQHVAAALALFASVATLFWYILRILMILNSRSR
jgi:FtsH-binding integral membrane protein